MRVLKIAGSLLLLPHLLSAQLSMDDFLWSALKAPAIQTFDNQNTYLGTNPYKLSFVRALEFRTESNQLDAERQDYALRLKAGNPWESKRNKEYFTTYQEVLQLERQREFKKILKDHYEAVIDWAYLSERKKLLQEEYELTQTMIKMLEAQRFSDFFDASDYANLKIEQVEKLVALEELYFEEDAKRGTIEKLYAQAKDQDITWSFDEIISIEDVLEKLAKSQQNLPEFGEVAYRKKQVELAQSEWALEKSNINLGFLQAQYQDFRIAQDRSPWSIGMGINIPIFNPNKANMTKRKLEILEAQGDLTDTENEQKLGMELEKKKIRSLANRYNTLLIQLDSLKVDELATQLNEINSNNPITLVKLRGSLIKSRNISALLRKEIFSAYINYLDQADLLQQQPLRNYLISESD